MLQGARRILIHTNSRLVLCGIAKRTWFIGSMLGGALTRKRVFRSLSHPFTDQRLTLLKCSIVLLPVVRIPVPQMSTLLGSARTLSGWQAVASPSNQFGQCGLAKAQSQAEGGTGG